MRLPIIYHDNVPYTFCDEDIITENSYRVYHLGIWSPGQFLYGGFNYYFPAMVAHIQDSLTGNHLGLREYIIFCRFLLAVVLSAFFVPLTVLAADNFFRNRRVSVLTGFVAALSPMALGLSRFAYPDHYFIFSSALVLWLCSLNQKRALLIASFVCGLSMGIKY